MRAKILSAGVVVVRRDGAGRCLYLLLRAYNYWDFPKGVVEPGEKAIDGARREVAEETTIDDLVFRWGYRYRETGPYGPGKVARYYIAETATDQVSLPVNPELGRPEHEEYRWVSLQQGLAMLAPRVIPVLRWAAGMAEEKPVSGDGASV